jgi:hypothetical protein
MQEYHLSLISWIPEEQFYPISPRMKGFFASESYKELYDFYKERGYKVWIEWPDAPEIWRFSLESKTREAVLEREKRFDEESDLNQKL